VKPGSRVGSPVHTNVRIMPLASLVQSFSRLAVQSSTPSMIQTAVTGYKLGLLAPQGLCSQLNQVRNFPKPILINKCYRRIVFKPEKYTTSRLPMRKLGGRDPVTGRIVVGKIGGGHKQKFRWVLYTRESPKDGKPVMERVLKVAYDPCRTARIAMVARDETKRWILATEKMKVGDIIKSCGEIPRIPVRGSEGDAHPLGALPVGSVVCNVETFPGTGGYFARAAGTSCQILRKVGDRVIIQAPSKHEISLSQECMAVLGRISNAEEAAKPVGSAQRNRWLGNRPCSGWWQRKDGYCGRKIRPLPPVKVYDKPPPREEPIYVLTK